MKAETSKIGTTRGGNEFNPNEETGVKQQKDSLTKSGLRRRERTNNTEPVFVSHQHAIDAVLCHSVFAKYNQYHISTPSAAQIRRDMEWKRNFDAAHFINCLCELQIHFLTKQALGNQKSRLLRVFDWHEPEPTCEIQLERGGSPQDRQVTAIPLQLCRVVPPTLNNLICDSANGRRVSLGRALAREHCTHLPVSSH